MKKKILFTLVAMSLLAFLAIGLVNAPEVGVTCNPETITTPGGTTTITVSCNETVHGSITVITPITNTPYVVSITVTGGSSTSKIYPTDFTGASSTEIGEYEVIVAVSDEDFRASFWVYFEVIPEIPFGTIMATIASFAALGVLIKKKRF